MLTWKNNLTPVSEQFDDIYFLRKMDWRKPNTFLLKGMIFIIDGEIGIFRMRFVS
ncbi:hypothetical protein LEP1GSC116_0245 [Leptospira interrogans serovar Icterohaemorrhagiae str. Verdun HP]|uniref:Uncharacterized protein n=1 Tax=Leptospira interrogans serovar Icterohaemorrhagiae str. Verdun HP TaxID=1049910 RepID=M6RIN2_LEPIR|nr:hypothetical protein LEP1GSC148_3802 [Leptospira interrogans serovar Canicola str. LT1962]EMO07435.1 hypothetical protein LEP1GSC116_0245 [Leptospira interrogans serovar Icterohaemorrhagiae str. Verdun HP]